MKITTNGYIELDPATGADATRFRGPFGAASLTVIPTVATPTDLPITVTEREIEAISTDAIVRDQGVYP